MPSEETFKVLTESRQRLEQVAQAESCGVCKSLLSDRAEDMRMTDELLRNVSLVVERRKPLETAVVSSQSMLGPTARPAPQAERKGGPLGILGNGGFGFRDLVQNRPKLKDLMPGKK